MLFLIHSWASRTSGASNAGWAGDSLRSGGASGTNGTRIALGSGRPVGAYHGREGRRTGAGRRARGRTRSGAAGSRAGLTAATAAAGAGAAVQIGDHAVPAILLPLRSTVSSHKTLLCTVKNGCGDATFHPMLNQRTCARPVKWAGPPLPVSYTHLHFYRWHIPPLSRRSPSSFR